MDLLELIKTRKSVRTFNGTEISDDDRKKLNDYIRAITNPYDIPVEFVMLNRAEYGLSSPVIEGEHLYIAGKVPKTEHCEEAFGYAFEKLVLYAWSLGIGTTWIGGTMKRKLFENAVRLKENEIMPCISPLGYPAKKKSMKEISMRIAIKADKRLPDTDLFFENSFLSPLNETDETVRSALEAVRFSPSAVNKQPWRIVKIGSIYHFYEKCSLGGNSGSGWDVQKVDMGIALCHFMEITNGKLLLSAPKIETLKNTEYIASVML